MKVKFTETAIRDAQQSLIATRMPFSDFESILETMDNAGYHSIECWGGATFDSCLRYLDEDPWERLRKIKAVVKISYDEAEKNMDVELAGDDMGILIGKRGQTLDSLQYLTSLVANKGTEEYIRVKVDTENYRERRKETLENLAKNMASKVKRTKRPVSLEPMNPYERRVIHSSLQDDRFVTTHSEGEEPYRHVVITLKK